MIAQIKLLHRERCFAMEQRKRLDLALGSYLRMQLGWSLALPEAERAEIKRLAKELAQEPTDDFVKVVGANIEACAHYVGIEKQSLKRLESLAKQLPVWPQFENVRGFGPGSLGVIVAEAGDLSNYSTHSKLWKRMGLAVMDGVRQGGLTKNAHKDDWIAHGYNRQRRSRMWNIGDSLIKSNRDGKYRTIYLERKEYERERAESNGLQVVPAAKIPAARKAEFMSEGHVHRRAQRYMEKRLLRDIWQAWNGAEIEVADRPIEALPRFVVQAAA